MAYEGDIPISCGFVRRASHSESRFSSPHATPHTRARSRSHRSIGERRQDSTGYVVADDEPRVAQGLVRIGVVEDPFGVNVLGVEAGAAVADDDAAQLFHRVLVCRGGSSRILEDEAEGEARADGGVGEQISVGGGNVMGQAL